MEDERAPKGPKIVPVCEKIHRLVSIERIIYVFFLGQKQDAGTVSEF